MALLPTTEINLNTVGVNAVFPVGSATIASVVVNPRSSAWGTAVVRAAWSNTPIGPWFTFAAGEVSAVTAGPGACAINWINVEGKAYFGVEVTTAEGASERADVFACTNA